MLITQHKLNFNHGAIDKIIPKHFNIILVIFIRKKVTVPVFHTIFILFVILKRNIMDFDSIQVLHYKFLIIFLHEYTLNCYS